MDASDGGAAPGSGGRLASVAVIGASFAGSGEGKRAALSCLARVFWWGNDGVARRAGMEPKVGPG